ncbi:TPA: glycosyltransferase family 2 protein [Salmonella enterica]|nr:glycosyltransferase family 2 protein [Salmonella enterica]
MLLINERYHLGFGANNNYIYKTNKKNKKIKDDDYIIILNPDVNVTTCVIKELINTMHKDNISIASINLYKDDNFTLFDNSIRNWPTFKDFFSSFIGKKNKSIIDKNLIHEPVHIDWAAGSFLALSASLYNKLKGFDEGYFMYCEDIDICYRASILQERMMYYPHFKAVHYAAHANRKIFSKHFFWHLKSICRFLLIKNMK